jgi:DnaK suppressor protein
MTDPTDTDLRTRYMPRLRAEADALRAASEGSSETRKPVELDQQMVGRLSRMDALQGQALAQGLEARRAGRLRAIAAAITRMDAGEFGYCEDCGEFIGAGRLDADTCVVRCVSCAG